MKRKFLWIALLIAVCSGCGKKDAARVPAPDWRVDNTGKYPATMTAVVRLPVGLEAGSGTGDKLAAFIQDECRGIGEHVEMDSSIVFFVLIQGESSENGKIQFRYYSGRESRIYETSSDLDFAMDGNYGTVDEPEMLELIPK